MRAKDIVIGEEYEARPSWHSWPSQVKILEQKAPGRWKGQVRDGSRWGSEVTVDSRSVLRLWSEAEAEKKLEDIKSKIWDEANEQANKQASQAIANIQAEYTGNDFKLEWIDVEADSCDMPGRVMVDIGMSLESLLRLEKLLPKNSLGRVQLDNDDSGDSKDICELLL